MPNKSSNLSPQVARFLATSYRYLEARPAGSGRKTAAWDDEEEREAAIGTARAAAGFGLRCAPKN